jgi:hypothetical protein
MKDNWDRFAIVVGALQWIAWIVCILVCCAILSCCSAESMERMEKRSEERAAERAKAEKERTVETTKAMRDLLRKTNPALPPAERCATIARMVQAGDCLECADDRALVTGVCEAALDSAREDRGIVGAEALDAKGEQP